MRHRGLGQPHLSFRQRELPPTPAPAGPCGLEPDPPAPGSLVSPSCCGGTVTRIDPVAVDRVGDVGPAEGRSARAAAFESRIEPATLEGTLPDSTLAAVAGAPGQDAPSAPESQVRPRRRLTERGRGASIAHSRPGRPADQGPPRAYAAALCHLYAWCRSPRRRRSTRRPSAKPGRAGPCGRRK